MKKLYQNYKHIMPLLGFMIIYLSWFSYLERTVTKGYHVIHMAVDNYIPFCEYFIVPYFLWFFYVTAVVLALFLKDKDSYYKACTFLCTGMTVFLVVSTFYPNGHHLRPLVMPNDNIFSQMVSALYRVDTATNLFPSIHVYNSLGALFAVMNSPLFAKKKTVKAFSFLLSSSIILSTVFLKQHSMFDVLTAFGLAAAMYGVVYIHDVLPFFRRVFSPAKQADSETGI